MQLWNSRTRTKEPFQAGPIVRIYVCGITPYATTHLGHGRTYLVFDVLYLDGRSTMSLPYTERRSLLEGLPVAGPCCQVPPTHAGIIVSTAARHVQSTKTLH